MENSNRKRLSIYLGSVGLAIWVSSQYLNQIVYLYLRLNRGYFTPIIIIASVFSVASIVLKRKIRTNKELVFVVTYLILYFVFTRIFQPGKSSLETVDFIGMCILPLIIGGVVGADYSLVFRICMWLLVLGIPVYSQLFLKANYGLNYDAVSMSMSYDILPITLVGVIHMIYFGRKSKIVDKMLYVISIVFCISLIRMSYRGALLALVVSVVLALYFRKYESDLNKQIRFVVICLFVVILALNFQNVLVLASNILNSFDIHIAFIDKTVYLMQYDSLGHGRLETYKLAFDGFLESPVWGHGLATFEYYTGLPFPHNFILEFMFDGGVLLSIPLLYIFISSIRHLLKNVWTGDRYWFAFTLMIGSIAITRGLISAESWRIVLLWLFLGICLNKEESVQLLERNEQHYSEI